MGQDVEVASHSTAGLWRIGICCHRELLPLNAERRSSASFISEQLRFPVNMPVKSERDSSNSLQSQEGAPRQEGTGRGRKGQEGGAAERSEVAGRGDRVGRGRVGGLHGQD